MKTLRAAIILALLAAAIPLHAQVSDTRIPAGNGYINLTSTCSNANTSCDTTGVTVFGPNGTVTGPQTLEFNTQSYGLAVIYVNGSLSTAVGSTIFFEFSDDGGTSWYLNICTRSDANIQESSEAVPTSTYRAWDCSVGAATRMRVRQSAISSGVLAVSATLTTGLLEPAPSVAISNTPGSGDPCQNPNVAKSSAFQTITTATTTALVAVSGTTQIYTCGFQITSIAVTSSNTVQLENGTGAACAGAPTAMTPVYTPGFAAALGAPPVQIVYGPGGGSALKPTPAGTGLCAVTTVGTTPTITVLVTFVQQ